MLSKDKIGDVVEYKAVAWLLSQGCEVFKNTASKGPIDLIALFPCGKVRLIDVKKVVDASRKVSKINHPRKTEFQSKLEVELLCYNEVCDKFTWSTEEIYRDLRKVPKKTVASSHVVGQYTGSLAFVCKSYGVNVRTVRSMMARDPSLTVDRAIERAFERKKSVVFRGIEYTDRQHMCNALNIPIGTLDYWMYEVGNTLEQAVTFCLEKRNAKQGEPDHQG